MKESIWVNVTFALVAGLIQPQAHADAVTSETYAADPEIADLCDVQPSALTRDELIKCLQRLKMSQKPDFGDSKPCVGSIKR